jgi:Mor family transcriptional regulator
MKRYRKSTEVQTVLFDKERWTVSAAKKWLKDHGYKRPSVDTTSEYHRFRQRPPFQFQKGTFRTINFGKNTGIKSVIAVPKTPAEKNPKISTKKKPKIPRDKSPKIRKKEDLPKRWIPHKVRPPRPPCDGWRKNPQNKKKKPWLPALLIDLAVPISVDLESGEQLKFPLRGKYSMAANRAGTEIWILPKGDSKNVRATDDRGEKLYEQFTGFEHDDLAKLVKVSPKSMVRIGRAMNIVYRSDKFARPGNKSDYVHPFEHYPIVSVDNIKHPSIVAIRGGRIKVTKEGITG